MSINVSVVIPTFKRPGLLLKCLSHLDQQQFAKDKYEIVIVTDGLDMETVTRVTDFCQQHIFLNISCYSLSEKKGPAAARNKGVECAKGELIVFTDDDCLPQQNWLNAYWSYYEMLDRTDMALTGQTIVPHSDTPTDYEKNIAQLQTAEFITANCAITKTAFMKLGGFNENFATAWREDSDMHFKLLKASVPVHQVKNAVVIHPVRKANWGISLKEQKKSLYNALLYKYHTDLYKQRISSQPLWNYYAMIILFCFSFVFLTNGLYTAALISLISWISLVADFTLQRLKSTSKTISHVMEMAVTSAIIPFLSVFWTLYGSFKYKTLFL